jgi:hypothetical protein
VHAKLRNGEKIGGITQIMECNRFSELEIISEIFSVGDSKGFKEKFKNNR